MKQTESEAARFWRKVSLTPGCWLWLGQVASNGYGLFRRDHAHSFNMAKAHVVMLERLGLRVPSLVADHLCRNRACVRPDHMEQVTDKENILRGEGAPAKNSRKTVCPRGHAFDRIRPSGWRRCSKCEKARSAARAKGVVA